MVSKIAVEVDGHSYTVDVELDRRGNSGLAVSVDGETLTVVVPDLGLPPHIMDWLIVDGRPYEIVVDRDLHWIKANKGLHRLEVRDLEAADARPASRDGRIKAPIPGLIARVLVEPAAQVAAGQPLLLLEAMKMENEIRAPFAGTVTSLNVQAGQEVALNQLLAEISGTLP